jgi:flavin reductase (DIM6/NTAB) family NADH-FMN oxidoreductase RutF
MSSAAAGLEAVFRLVDREIWIVTTADGQRRGGLTATWVSQASIDAARPLALIGLAPNHFTAELVDASGVFALHMLASEQTDVAWNFANGSGRHRDKFTDITTHAGVTGSPLLEPCLARLECQVFARLATGDRNYYWADVVAGDDFSSDSAGHGRPLTEQQFIQGMPDDRRSELIAGRDRDISVQRPLIEAWRRDLPDLLRCP